MRPYAEFGGIPLIAELQWGYTQTPDYFGQETIAYRGVVAADGSGTYPVPVEDVRYEAMTHNAVFRRTVTTSTINGPVDDESFDIDVTLASRILDMSTPFVTPLTQPSDQAPGSR